MLDKKQKRVCGAVGISLVGYFEPLAYSRNSPIRNCRSVSQVLLWNNVHLNYLNWFLFLTRMRVLLVILIDCFIFMSLFLDIIRMCMSTVSFLVHIHYDIFACIKFSFDLIPCFKSRVNRHLPSLGSFSSNFLSFSSSMSSSFFCNYMPNGGC